MPAFDWTGPSRLPPSLKSEAAENDQTERVKSLLAAGADVNAKAQYGETALAWAASGEQTESVLLLLVASWTGSEHRGHSLRRTEFHYQAITPGVPFF